jgi:hypothetical protein
VRLTSLFKRRENPRDDFARRIMARLRERGWPHELTYDAGRFAVALGDGGGGVMHLENTYREWLRFPEVDREGALDAAVAHVLEDKAPLGLEEALDLLLPAIRNRFDVESVGRGDEASRRVASAPVAGHLAVLVAIDREHSISMVSDAQVAEWGVSFDSLLERAVANLESRSPCRFERHEGGFFVSDFGDYYDTSRLLVPRLFDQLELKGDPIAVAVSRTGLVVTGQRGNRASGRHGEVREPGRAQRDAPDFLRAAGLAERRMGGVRAARPGAGAGS